MLVDDFVGSCVAAMAETEPRRAMRAVLEEALAKGVDLPPMDAGLNILHNTAGLTVLNVVWPAQFTLLPHDHRMWAAIAIYTGREDNTFFRRASGSIVESGGRRIEEGDVVFLGDDTIHSVHNPSLNKAGAIHVYGGDFVREPRSQWTDGTEQPYDMAAVQVSFRAGASEP